MKYKILEIIKCPNCGGSFQVVAESEIDGDKLKNGEIKCLDCSVSYPVRNYIPRLISENNYSESWGELWKETGSLLRDSTTGIPFHYNVIHGHYKEDETGYKDGYSPFGFEWETNLEGQDILEIGPGTGNCTEILLKTGANLVCVDMSDAIDTFTTEMLQMPNLHVIQGDINESILKKTDFDRIWFFQVLQHTPKPEETLKNIRKYLKMGGELAFTSYGGEKRFNPWYYKFTKSIDDKKAWKYITVWVPRLVKFKYLIHKINIPIFSKLLLLLLAPIDPRNIYYATLQGKSDDYIHGKLWKETNDREKLMQYVIINTFDRITPEYTNNASHEMIEKWTLDAGFSTVKTWGKSGVRAKAIK